MQNEQGQVVGLFRMGTEIPDFFEARIQHHVGRGRGVTSGQRLNAAKAEFVTFGVKHLGEAVGIHQ